MSNPSTNSSEQPSMKIPIDPSRVRQLAQNLASIQKRILSTLEQGSSQPSHAPHLYRRPSNPPRLVAVSKLKPASDILALHRGSATSENEENDNSSNSNSSHSGSHRGDGQLHFGENYVQELVEKAGILPRTIRWHFIGGLQSNKCASLARSVPNLWAVESVDSVKKATLLNRGRQELFGTDTNADKDTKTDIDQQPSNIDAEQQLRVFVQVNTSGEESKSGVSPQSDELLELCRTVHGDDTCPYLKLQGLMTVGAIVRSQATTADNANEDFDALRECRDWVAQEMGLDLNLDGGHALELSMGMSEDFEGAILQGSDEVRVGSTIFGERPPKSEAKVLEHTETEKK